MKKILLLFLIGLLISSCATVLNPRTKVLTIITSEPAKIVVKEDTLSHLSKKRDVLVERSKDSLYITAYNRNKSKSVSIPARNSFAWWLNLYPSTLWTGFLIDKNNPKRYNYTSTIYVDMDQKGNHFKTYEPIDMAYSKHSSVLKLNPLKAMSFFNAGMEIAWEQRMSNSMATQFSAAYLFPMSIRDLNADFKPQIKGYQLGVEERYYFKKSGPAGPYLGLEFGYLNNRYKDRGYFGKADLFADSTTLYTNYADTFGIRKQTYTLNLKIGYQFIRKRWSIDLYTGFGTRYKDVVQFDKIKPEDELGRPTDLNVNYITNKNGRYWTVSIPFNIRVGWTF